MVSTDPNHPGATYMMCTCNNRPGRPALGAWTVYALGSENQNLPGYVLLRDPGMFHSGGAMQITNAWLPAQFRGIELSSEGDPILSLHPAEARPAGIQKNNLRMLDKLNELHHQRYPHEADLASRIQNYELAARMQLRATGELDLSGETEATNRLYDPVTASYGQRLLLARRLVERGVRFVQVLSPGLIVPRGPGTFLPLDSPRSRAVPGFYWSRNASWSRSPPEMRYAIRLRISSWVNVLSSPAGISDVATGANDSISWR